MCGWLTLRPAGLTGGGWLKMQMGAGVFAGPRGRGRGDWPNGDSGRRDGMMRAAVSSLALAYIPITQSAGHPVWYSSNEECCCAVLADKSTVAGPLIRTPESWPAPPRSAWPAWHGRDQDFQEIPQEPSKTAKQAKQRIKLRAQDPKTSQDLPRPPKTIRLTHRKSLTLTCGGADTTTSSPSPADLYSPCSIATADGARQGVNGASVGKKTRNESEAVD